MDPEDKKTYLWKPICAGIENTENMYTFIHNHGDINDWFELVYDFDLICDVIRYELMGFLDMEFVIEDYIVQQRLTRLVIKDSEASTPIENSEKNESKAYDDNN